MGTPSYKHFVMQALHYEQPIYFLPLLILKMNVICLREGLMQCFENIKHCKRANLWSH